MIGLIDKYGADLQGKVFIWYGDFAHTTPGDVWLIGKITRFRPHFALYEVLLSNHVGLDPYESGARCRAEFFSDDSLDKNSILIGCSSELEQYLELFDGTN